MGTFFIVRYPGKMARSRRRRVLFRRIHAACVVFVCVAAVSARGAAAEGISVGEAWARASAGAARSGAAFLVIENRGGTDDALVAAQATISDAVELHTHVEDGGVMKMRKVDRIPVPAGSRIELKPGGLHVMFIGLKQPLQEGATFAITLDFEKGGRFLVPATVKGVGAR
jgi:copper(I)-binding protein